MSIPGVVFVFLFGALLVRLTISTDVEDDAEWRIVGGEKAPEGAYPYQASLRTRKNFHFCGGSVIGARTILTAAHCVEGKSPENLKIVVGTNHISDGGTDYNVTSIKRHPDYDSDMTYNDVALVVVDSDIEMTPKVRAIEVGDLNLGGDVPVTLTGWGRTSYPGNAAKDLQVLSLKTITFDQCRKRYSELKAEERIVVSSLCTLTKFGEGACHGDSGGPLVADDKVVGVVSWGSPCARGYPDVFARVHSFAGWIKENKM